MTSRLDVRYLGLAVAVVAALGCAAKDPPAQEAPQLLQVALTAATPSQLPACTKALKGTTAATEAPAGIWSCQGSSWIPIPCANLLAGAVAYASATQSLWACSAGQWVKVVLPGGPEGPAGEQGETGAPGSDGKPGATSVIALTVEPPGANCANGGTRISSGLDANGNGTLDDGEGTAASYVCNGAATPPPGSAGIGDLSLSCASASQDGVVEAVPGSPVAISGMVSGGVGVTILKVNGVPALLDSAGAFTTSIDSRYGANHVVLEASDGAGHLRRGLCSFLVADQFVGEGARLGDGATLRLAQAAIDDGNRSGPIDSLADVLATVLNSKGFHTTLHESAMAANPLKPSSCDLEFGVCLHSSEVIYLGLSLPGPNTVTASLVAGGARVVARLEHPVAQLRVRGEFLGDSYDTTGDVTVDFLEVDATFDLGLDLHLHDLPFARIRPGSLAVRLGTIDPNFTGEYDDLLNFVGGIARDALSSTLASTLEDTIASSFNSTLAGVFSSFDVSGLATSFLVPRFDGTGTTAITFDARISSIDASASRLLLGAGTRFSAAAAHSRLPNRIPLPPGAVRRDAEGTAAVAVAEHIGVLQQALHANWRGGGLDGAVTAAGGTNVAFVATLPPVVFVKEDGSIGLDLGIDATVSLPGTATPIHARAAVRATANVSLASEDLVFGGVRLDESHVTADVDLSTADASALNASLFGLLAEMASRSLDDTIPRLPIPAFSIPAALGAYGLPAGDELGLVNATMTIAGQHAMLRGGFGAR